MVAPIVIGLIVALAVVSTGAVILVAESEIPDINDPQISNADSNQDTSGLPINTNPTTETNNDQVIIEEEDETIEVFQGIIDPETQSIYEKLFADIKADPEYNDLVTIEELPNTGYLVSYPYPCNLPEGVGASCPPPPLLGYPIKSVTEVFDNYKSFDNQKMNVHGTYRSIIALAYPDIFCGNPTGDITFHDQLETNLGFRILMDSTTGKAINVKIYDPSVSGGNIGVGSPDIEDGSGVIVGGVLKMESYVDTCGDSHVYDRMTLYTQQKFELKPISPIENALASLNLID